MTERDDSYRFREVAAKIARYELAIKAIGDLGFGDPFTQLEELEAPDFVGIVREYRDWAREQLLAATEHARNAERCYGPAGSDRATRQERAELENLMQLEIAREIAEGKIAQLVEDCLAIRCTKGTAAAELLALLKVSYARRRAGTHPETAARWPEDFQKGEQDRDDQASASSAEDAELVRDLRQVKRDVAALLKTARRSPQEEAMMGKQKTGTRPSTVHVSSVKWMACRSSLREPT